jgi:hypothetical protein
MFPALAGATPTSATPLVIKNKIKRSFISSPFLVQSLKLSATSPNSKTRNKWIYANSLLRRARPKPIKPRPTFFVPPYLMSTASRPSESPGRPMEFAHLPVRWTLLAARATRRLI